ncbi:hypothetical protein EWU20_00350 [Aquirufa antheringensis]|uniref:Uncharacterized protein n=1 Tax=Aquirufa antheringensis TaxID=2516559 RepID=A0A4V2IW72_9BACT|nr:hypothetical protein [Aquirufa antheringensis]TBH75055.1 hypothetical protein EWU20_00350 [Aquirufa antheringensis]
MIRPELNYLYNAISNEIYLDSRFNSLIDNSKVRISKELPKFQTRLNAFNLYGDIYLILEFLLSKFYYFFTFFLFQFVFIKSFFRVLFSSHKSIDCKHLFFINSPVSAGLAKKFIAEEKIDLKECAFFIINDDLRKYLDKSCKYFSSNEIISFRSLLACLYFSFEAFFLFKGRFKVYNFLYLNWLIQLEALKRISYRYFHSFDHYDRYAILAESQSYFKGQGSVEYFLHQHGKFNTIDSEFSLPYKLKNVSSLVLFDNNSSLLFLQKYVIDKDCIVNDVILQNNYLVTVKDFNEKRFKIFIIGNLVCYQLHKRFIKSLESNSNVILYYKPHPSNLVYMENKKNCINIKDVQYFPDVNVVVSYDSTLLDEYTKLGYFCIRHSLDETNELNILNNLNKFYNDCQ